MRAHLVTFASEGPPFGLNLTTQAEAFRRAFQAHADTVTVYTPRSLNGLSVANVTHRQALRRLPGSFANNPGMEHLGGMTVKPWVLLLRLTEIEEGDLLVWKDVNVRKHPNLLADPEDLRATSLWALQTVGRDIFMPYENPYLKLKHHCKAFTVREMAHGRPLRALYNYPLHHANLVILRKSPESYAHLLEWLQACLHDDWIGPLPNPAPHPEFRWHTNEQCLFSLLMATGVPYKRQLWFCWRHRIRSARFLDGHRVPCKRPSSELFARWNALA